jgi:hypothetical protein
MRASCTLPLRAKSRHACSKRAHRASRLRSWARLRRENAVRAFGATFVNVTAYTDATKFVPPGCLAPFLQKWVSRSKLPRGDLRPVPEACTCDKLSPQGTCFSDCEFRSCGVSSNSEILSSLAPFESRLPPLTQGTGRRVKRGVRVNQPGRPHLIYGAFCSPFITQMPARQRHEHILQARMARHQVHEVTPAAA